VAAAQRSCIDARLLLAAAGGLLLINIAGPALADDCAEAGTQSELNHCAMQSFQTADAALNRAYLKIQGRLKKDPAAERLLVTAQKAWLRFRDAECTFSASPSMDGSIYPMLIATCRAALTNARTQQLEAYLNCREGELSCPVPPN